MEKYEKIKVVGRGASGVVHLCKHRSDEKLVIIKEIPVEQMSKEERQSALTEIKLLLMLKHPHIVGYFDDFMEDKSLMIVMEYMEGGTLFEYLQSRGGRVLSEETVLRLLSQMLLALHHVHSKQILHRDLKTHNILLDRRRLVAKIGDFGISKVLDSRSKAVSVVGTPCYLSPELCRGQPYNQRSDIWALGCVLYEMVTLRRAFEAASLPALVLKILRGAVKPLPAVYSLPLRRLVSDMLQLEPPDRPSTTALLASPLLLPYVLDVATDVGALICPTKRRSSKVLLWGGSYDKPTALSGVGGEMREVQSGRSMLAGLTSNGHLLLWEHQLGQFCPRIVPSLTVRQLACGGLFALILTDAGLVLSMGALGEQTQHGQPAVIQSLLGMEVVHLAAGESHAMVLTSEGQLLSWGNGGNGRLGLGQHESVQCPSPVPLPSGMRPKSVFCGQDCSALVTDDGRLLVSGSNRFQKLLLGDLSESVHFRAVEAVDLVAQVAFGSSHTLVRTEEGSCWAAGSNRFGQLGTEDGPIVRLQLPRVCMVSAGDTFSIAVCEHHQVFSWGNMARGRLGRAGGPAMAPLELPAGRIRAVSSSHARTLLLIDEECEDVDQ